MLPGAPASNRLSASQACISTPEPGMLWKGGLVTKTWQMEELHPHPHVHPPTSTKLGAGSDRRWASWRVPPAHRLRGRRGPQVHSSPKPCPGRALDIKMLLSRSPSFVGCAPTLALRLAGQKERIQVPARASFIFLPTGLARPAERAEQAEPLSNRLKAPPSAAYRTLPTY